MPKERVGKRVGSQGLNASIARSGATRKRTVGRRAEERKGRDQKERLRWLQRLLPLQRQPQQIQKMQPGWLSLLIPRTRLSERKIHLRVFSRAKRMRMYRILKPMTSHHS